MWAGLQITRLTALREPRSCDLRNARPTHCLCGHSGYYPLIKKAIRTKWQGEWTLVLNNKLRLIRASASPWQSSAQDQISRERLLTRLRIGHTFLTHILWNKDTLLSVTTALCRSGWGTSSPSVQLVTTWDAHFPNIDGDYDEAMKVILVEGDQCNFDAAKLIAFLTACDVLDKL